MTRREVRSAYPALKREWPGRVIRTVADTHPGFPDFLLLYRGVTLYAEVKWLPDVARPKQLVFLDQLFKEGHPCAVLGYGESGWTAWIYDFMKLVNVTLEPDGGHISSPRLDGPKMLKTLLST